MSALLNRIKALQASLASSVIKEEAIDTDLLEDARSDISSEVHLIKVLTLYKSCHVMWHSDNSAGLRALCDWLLEPRTNIVLPELPCSVDILYEKYKLLITYEIKCLANAVTPKYDSLGTFTLPNEQQIRYATCAVIYLLLKD